MLGRDHHHDDHHHNDHHHDHHHHQEHHHNGGLLHRFFQPPRPTVIIQQPCQQPVLIGQPQPVYVTQPAPAVMVVRR